MAGAKETDSEGQEPVEAEQLALNDEDEERLPWLESGDEFEYEEGPDMGRVLGLSLLGLVALAALVGGIWWSSHRTPDPTLVADGSTIKAPDTPYKQAPTQPGGKTFQGTGDTAFAVSEGHSQAARLGEAPKPTVDLTPKPPVPPVGKAVATTGTQGGQPSGAPAAAGGAAGTLVQVGAYSNRAAAEAAWSRLSGQYSALSGQRHQVAEGQADIGTVFRLQALAGSADGAHALCARLKTAGLACQVK